MGRLTRNRKKDRAELDQDEIQLDKNDRFAMFIAGVLMIGLPCFLLLLIIVGVIMLLFA